MRFSQSHPKSMLLGRYRTMEEIGRGAEGIVYKGVDSRNGRTVAVKTIKMPTDERKRANRIRRFHQERDSRIEHPAIISSIDGGQHQDSLVLVYPFVDAPSLDMVVECGKPFPIPEVIKIAKSTLLALDYLHTKGFVHRDVKHSNLLYVRGAGVFVIDLSIMLELSSSRPGTRGGLVGTPPFTAPEQICDAGGVGPRADLHSMGVLIYQLLTGKLLYVGANIDETIQNVLNVKPLPAESINPNIPSHLSNLCSRLLVKDPSLRIHSAKASLRMLLPGDQPAQCDSCRHSLAYGRNYCSECGAPTKHPPAKCIACGGVARSESDCPHCRCRYDNNDSCLYFHAGPLRGFVFRIPMGSYVVGRRQLGCRDLRISRQHIRVLNDGCRVSVSDTGSKNGLFVQGAHASEKTPLNIGNRLAIGDSLATFIYRKVKGYLP